MVMTSVWLLERTLHKVSGAVASETHLPYVPSYVSAMKLNGEVPRRSSACFPSLPTPRLVTVPPVIALPEVEYCCQPVLTWTPVVLLKIIAASRRRKIDPWPA